MKYEANQKQKPMHITQTPDVHAYETPQKSHKAWARKAIVMSAEYLADCMPLNMCEALSDAMDEYENAKTLFEESKRNLKKEVARVFRQDLSESQGPTTSISKESSF